MSAQHSSDFRRRLKQMQAVARDKMISTAKDTVPVEQQLSKEELAKLHDNIRFTQTVMSEEAKKRWDQ